ncbi:hypothetical protein ACFLFF_32065, partial [Brevibacillus reuszeri]|uniref:hypothetical protein n=1 Tax=Brevibacillus reuszeri TaxID=54915 RepID=UPI00366F11B7
AWKPVSPASGSAFYVLVYSTSGKKGVNWHLFIALGEKQISDLRSGLHPARKRGLSAAQQFTGKRQSGSCFVE